MGFSLFGVVGVLLISFICSFNNYKEVSAQTIDASDGEGDIVYLHLPYNGVHKITRTGWLYQNEYTAQGIQVGYFGFNGIYNCIDSNSTMNHNNFFCFHTGDYNKTEYHDSTDNRYNPQVSFQRGAVDIGMDDGTTVLAASRGKVEVATTCVNDEGGYVYIRMGIDTPNDSSDDYQVRYLHLKQPLVNVGDIVDVGKEIALSDSCEEGAAHLHISVYDPTLYHEVEIRWLDAQPMMVAGGLPIPSRRFSGGGNGAVTGQVYYIADENKTVRDTTNRSRLMNSFQYGREVKLVENAQIYLHDNAPGAINTVDLANYFTANSQALQYGEIYRAPVNWSGTYPYTNGGIPYWFYKASNGTEGWVSEGLMNGCLSAEWCDVAPTDQLYPFAVAAKARSEKGGGGFEGCDTNESAGDWLCSDYPISRGEAAKVLWEVAMGQNRKPADCSQKPFNDVEFTDTFCPYIQRLKDLGIIEGKGDGTNFDPSGYITNGEFASIVTRAMTHRNYGRFECNLGNTEKFAQFVTDVAVDNPHYQSILCMWNATRDYNGLMHQKYQRSIILTTQNRIFGIDKLITRLETTKFLALSLALLGEPGQSDENGGNNNQGSGRCWNVFTWFIDNCNNVNSAEANDEQDNQVDFLQSTPYGDQDWIVIEVDDTFADLNIFAINKEPYAYIAMAIFDTNGNMIKRVDPQFQSNSIFHHLDKGRYYVRFTNEFEGAFWGTNYTVRIAVQQSTLVNFDKSMASASASRNSGTAYNAIDGNTGTYWGASDFAPQSIKINFGQRQLVDSLRLLPDQSPAGRTVHDIYMYFDEGCNQKQFLGRIGQETAGNVWVNYDFPITYNPYCVQIETVSSPSWIAWWEIEVLHWQINSPLPIPANDGLPESPDPSTSQGLYAAASVENFLIQPSTSEVNFSFRIYNSSNTDHWISQGEEGCKIGSWKISFARFAQDASTIEAEGNLVNPTCLWINGEYIEVSAVFTGDYQPGTYRGVLTLYSTDLNLSDKRRLFNFITSAEELSNQIYLPLVTK